MISLSTQYGLYSVVYTVKCIEYIISNKLQGVPKNCIHFVFADFSASRAPKGIAEGIF